MDNKTSLNQPINDYNWKVYVQKVFIAYLIIIFIFAEIY